MTKRKNPEEKASHWSQKPTSRKRVAFSAPKGAVCCPTPENVFNLLRSRYSIKQNALTSPLLRLPLEIRNRIWSEVLGDRLIHLWYLYDDEVSFETNEELHSGLHWSSELKTTYGSAWRHVVCEKDCPENQEDEKRTTSDGETYSITSHQICEMNLHYEPIKPNKIYKESYYDGREMMRLSVLRSCRQIYVEANIILWTTNTFSFADATTLKRFMMTRTIHQKRSIESIRLQMEFNSYGYKEWNTALNMPLVRSLYGLRRLRLRIEHEMDARTYEYAKSHNLLFTTSYCEGLQKVSTLPLTQVEIVARNPLYIPEHDLWTKADREDFAEGLRKILLNPKGAQIYADDQLRRKEACRKRQELEAEIKASMSRPRLQAEAESMVDSPLAGLSEM